MRPCLAHSTVSPCTCKSDIVRREQVPCHSDLWQYRSLRALSSSMSVLFWFSKTATRFSRHLTYSFFFRRHSRAASLQRKTISLFQFKSSIYLSGNMQSSVSIDTDLIFEERVVFVPVLHEADFPLSCGLFSASLAWQGGGRCHDHTWGNSAGGGSTDLIGLNITWSSCRVDVRVNKQLVTTDNK